jgi:hypothetical protein
MAISTLSAANNFGFKAPLGAKGCKSCGKKN